MQLTLPRSAVTDLGLWNILVVFTPGPVTVNAKSPATVVAFAAAGFNNDYRQVKTPASIVIIPAETEYLLSAMDAHHSNIGNRKRQRNHR